MQKAIPDSLRTGMRILFIGYNPSLRSGELGHNYASNNNRFWKLLHEAGLTDRLVKATEDRDLLEIGYGFTNIVSRPTRRADEITKEEYAAGRIELRNTIATYRPRVACFVGKGVYEQYSRRKQIPWGVQQEPMVPGVIDFVAPSSSGLVRMPFAEVAAIYRQLTDLIAEMKDV
ncbi:MAG: mismatch-specific DNA-glycosylase [Tumebacillaceae bacterium]